MGILTKYKQNSNFRNIIWISLIYLLAHGFLLVATGRWWDDWIYADKNWDYLYEVMMQSSLPLSAFLDGSNWLFPDGFYRVLVFMWYYCSTILFYKILGKIEFFDSDACFWITILFSVIPVNDARIIWIIYPYAVGLTFFFLGFYIAISNVNVKSKKGIIRRIISIVFLMLAYCFIQSSMMLTIPLVLYLYYVELKSGWNWGNAKENIRKFLRTVLHHLDYLLAPVVWYFGDKLLFPGYGEYGGVYYIHWSDLPGIILRSPLYACATLKKILLTYVNLLKDSKVAVLVIILVVAYIIVLKTTRKKSNSGKDALEQNSFLRDCMMTGLGAFVFFLGFFPYAVKRNSAIEITHTGGRDAVLLGVGTAVLLYYGVYAIFRKNIIKEVLLSLVVLGVVHFNFMYLDWQESYYQQLQLQHEIAQNDNIKNNDTFLIMYKGAMICSNFYQTNGNSYAATGEQTRYYMPGTTYLKDLIDMNDESWSLNAFGMNEYEYGDKTIDGIIFVDYADISRKTIRRQKWNEIFNKEEFDAWIDKIKDIKYVAITKDESDKLLEMYLSEELDDAKIYDMYY